MASPQSNLHPHSPSAKTCMCTYCVRRAAIFKKRTSASRNAPEGTSASCGTSGEQEDDVSDWQADATVKLKKKKKWIQYVVLALVLLSASG